jgi:hypothetical protein
MGFMRNPQSGRVFDVKHPERDGSDCKLNNYNYNWLGERFYFEFEDSTWFRIRNPVNGYYLTAGAPHVTYLDKNSNYQWWRRDGGAIRNYGTNSCIDIAGGSRDAGARILMYRCHGGGNQKWDLVRY